MKHPKLRQLRLNRKMKVTEIRKLKQELNEIVEDCLVDIRWYIVDDLIRLLKKRGMVYAKKTSKKNKKTKKR